MGIPSLPNVTGTWTDNICLFLCCLGRKGKGDDDRLVSVTGRTDNSVDLKVYNVACCTSRDKIERQNQKTWEDTLNAINEAIQKQHGLKPEDIKPAEVALAILNLDKEKILKDGSELTRGLYKNMTNTATDAFGKKVEIEERLKQARLMKEINAQTTEKAQARIEQRDASKQRSIQLESPAKTEVFPRVCVKVVTNEGLEDFDVEKLISWLERVPKLNEVDAKEIAQHVCEDIADEDQISIPAGKLVKKIARFLTMAGFKANVPYDGFEKLTELSKEELQKDISQVAPSTYAALFESVTLASSDSFKITPPPSRSVSLSPKAEEATLEPVFVLNDSPSQRLKDRQDT